jgi:hypothetical protein
MTGSWTNTLLTITLVADRSFECTIFLLDTIRNRNVKWIFLSDFTPHKMPDRTSLRRLRITGETGPQSLITV